MCRHGIANVFLPAFCWAQNTDINALTGRQNEIETGSWRGSTACERKYREQVETDALLVDDHFRVVKRKCALPGCGGDIPTWRNGHRVTSDYCKPACQEKAARDAKRHGYSENAVLHENSPQKPLFHAGLQAPALPSRFPAERPFNVADARNANSASVVAPGYVLDIELQREPRLCQQSVQADCTAA